MKYNNAHLWQLLNNVYMGCDDKLTSNKSWVTTVCLNVLCHVLPQLVERPTAETVECVCACVRACVTTKGK